MKIFDINKIKTYIVNTILRRFRFMEVFKKLRVFLQGKKTYLTATLGIITALLAFAADTMTPGELVIALIAALTAITGKAGQAR